MKTYFLILPLLLAGSAWATEVAAKPVLTAEMDSIECNFAPQEGQPPCTVRIHLVPEPGISIVSEEQGDANLMPLQCVDGRGNLLLGTLREWEDCYDGNDDCRTAVYDFFAAPQGSSITFDTHLPVPTIRKQEKPLIVPFSPTTKAELEVDGHVLRVEPRTPSAEAKHALQVAFDIVYDHPDSIKLFRLCTPEGAPIHARAKVYDKDKAGISPDSARVTYIMYADNQELKLAITPRPICRIEQVPFRVRVSIGALDDKPGATTKPAK